MHALRRRKKLACLTTAFMFFAIQCAPLQAGLVSTESAFEQARILVADRAELMAAIDRADIRADLVALGADPEQVKQRVASMTDAELAELQGKLDTLAAGGDALNTIAFIFIVLLITDIAGLTDIFPFVKK